METTNRISPAPSFFFLLLMSVELGSLDLRLLPDHRDSTPSGCSRFLKR